MNEPLNLQRPVPYVGIGTPIFDTLAAEYLKHAMAEGMDPIDLGVNTPGAVVDHAPALDALTLHAEDPVTNSAGNDPLAGTTP